MHNVFGDLLFSQRASFWLFVRRFHILVAVVAFVAHAELRGLKVRLVLAKD